MEGGFNWYTQYKVPPDFTGTPEPLIFLVGLNIEGNQIHRCAWEMLNQKSLNKEFQPNYKCVPVNHEFPQKKAKLENIETYVPNGILNARWTSKHLNQIPSAVVLFFDMNWTDPHWNDKKAECSKMVKDLKSNLSPHGTQVLVMLIRDIETSEDDNFSTERASALCASAEIPPKCLFVLAHNYTERIQACVQRLEAGIYELSKSYYIARVRRVKNWKDRTTQLPLLSRYNIKMGFFHEIRKDNPNALSHYQTALSALLGIKSNDSIVQELKVVASILNYRICRIYLLKGDYKEAKSQFEKHISSFMKLEGNPKLIFEHWAWLELQYFQFGELLKFYHRFGTNLPNPNTYFMQASTYAEKRKEFKEKNIPKNQELSPTLDAIAKNGIRYLGQRPWTSEPFAQDKHSIYEDPKAIALLKYSESTINHSDLIINYLGIASEFCLKIQRMRTRCTILSMMGKELYSSKEYGKCLTLLSIVLREFGKEKWNKIIYFVVDLGLKAASAEGDVSKYLIFLIFLLKLDLQEFVPKERRYILWAQFQSILNNQIPRAEEGCELDTAKWEASLAAPSTTYVDIHTDSILDCQVFFLDESVKILNSAQIRFLVKNMHDFPISIRKYGVRFNLAEYNTESDAKNCLQPSETCELELSIKPSPRDISKLIKIQVAYIDIGKDDKSIFLHYSLVLAQDPYLWTTEWKKDVTRQSSLKIEPAKPLLKIHVERNVPALVNEWHKILVKWTNEDSIAYGKISLLFSLSASEHEKTSLTFDPRGNGETGQFNLNHEIEALPPSKSFEKCVYLKATNSSEDDLKILLRAKYIDGSAQPMILEHIEPISVICPFDIQQSLRKKSGEKSDSCIYSEEESCLCLTIRNNSNSLIFLKKYNLNLTSKNLSFRKYEDSSSGKSIDASEKLDLLFLITDSQPSENNENIGHLDLEWFRENNDDLVGCTQIPILPLTCLQPPLYIMGNFERIWEGKAKVHLEASYRIINRSFFELELCASMDSNENFMNAGPKKVTIKLGAKDYTDLNFILFPLVAGLISLPKLNIDFLNNVGGMDSTSIYSDVPKSIFIKP